MKNQEAAAYSKEPSYRCFNSMRSRSSNRFSHMLDPPAIAQLQSELFPIEGDCCLVLLLYVQTKFFLHAYSSYTMIEILIHDT